MKEPTRLYSIQMTDEDRDKLKAIAEYRGVTMAAAFRQWIRASHKKIEGIK
jgi:predicted DNA-binding protein